MFESYGLTPSQAIKLFLTQVAQTNQVPLSFEYQKVAAVSQDDLPTNKEHTEPPRDCRRLNILREYNDENTTLHPRD